MVKNYPKSPKASDALLKVGVIMQEKGQKDKARAVYQQVGKLYPSAEAAKQAQNGLRAVIATRLNGARGREMGQNAQRSGSWPRLD